MRWACALVTASLVALMCGLGMTSAVDPAPLPSPPPWLLIQEQIRGEPQDWGCDRELAPSFRVRSHVFGLFGVENVYMGNGFATTDGLYTAAHVVEGAFDIIIIDHTGREWPVANARQLSDDNGPIDVAILTIMGEVPPFTLLQMSDEEPAFGSPVRMRGYFGNSGFLDGVLVSVDGHIIDGGIPSWWESNFGGTPIAVDFVANKGLSGSPLLLHGRVVGLLSGGTPNGVYFSRIK